MPYGSMGSIWAEIGLDISRLTGDISQTKNLLDDVDRSVSAKAEKISQSLGQMGKMLSVGITTPIMGAATLATKFSIDFEKSMANVWTIVDGGKDVIAGMAKEVDALTRVIPQSASKLADGLYQVISASVPAEKAMGVLEVSAKAASAGLADTAVAVDALTSVINAYGFEAEEAGRLSDIMFKTVEKGKITFPELAQNIGGVVSTAATAGVAFEDLSAGIATLTKLGVTAPEAVTSLNQAILSFIRPTDQAAEAAESLGLEFSATALASKGLYGMLEDINEATGGNIELLGKLFPNVRSLKGVLGLLRQDVGLFKGDLEAMTTSLGATDAAFEKQSDTVAYTMEIFKNQIASLGRTFGDELLPVLKDVMERATQLAEGFKEIPESTRKTIIQFGLLAAAAGPVMLALSGIITLLSGPAGIVVGAIAAAGALTALVKHFMDVEGRLTRTAKAADAHADALKDERIRAEELAEKLKKLTQERDTLLETTERSKDENKKLATVQEDIEKVSKELVKIIPTLAKAYDDEGNAVINLAGALGELQKMRKAEYIERAKAAESYVLAARARVDEAEEKLKQLDAAYKAFTEGEKVDPWAEGYLAQWRYMVGAEEAMSAETRARLDQHYNEQKRAIIKDIEKAKRDLYEVTQRLRGIGMTAETGLEPGKVSLKWEEGLKDILPDVSELLEKEVKEKAPDLSAWEMWVGKVHGLSEASYKVLRDAFDDIDEALKSGDIVLRIEAEQRMSNIMSFLSDAVAEYGTDWDGKIAPLLSEYIKRGYVTIGDAMAKEQERFQKALERSRQKLRLVKAGMLAPDDLAHFRILDEESVADYLLSQSKTLESIIKVNRLRIEAILEGKEAPTSWPDLKMYDYAHMEEGLKAGREEVARLTKEEWDRIEQIITIVRLRLQAVMEGKAPGEVSWPDLKMWDYATMEEGRQAGLDAVKKMTEKEIRETDMLLKRIRLKIQGILEGKEAPTSWPDLKMYDYAHMEEGLKAGREEVERLTREETERMKQALELARLKMEAVLKGARPVGAEDWALLKMLDEQQIQAGLEAGKKAVEEMIRYESELYEFRKSVGAVTFEEELTTLQQVADRDAETSQERLKRAEEYYGKVRCLIATATDEELEALEQVLEAALIAFEAMGEAGEEMALAVRAALDEIRDIGEAELSALEGRISKSISTWVIDLSTGVKTIEDLFHSLGQAILKFFVDIVAKQIASSVASSVASASASIQAFGQTAGAVLGNIFQTLQGLGPAGWAIAGAAAIVGLGMAFGPKAPEVSYAPIYDPNLDGAVSRTVQRQAMAPISVVFSSGAIQVVNPNRIEDIVDQVSRSLTKRLEDEDILFGVGAV